MKEAYRDRSTVPLVEHIVQDVRFALRQLGQEPGLRRHRHPRRWRSAWAAAWRVFGFVDAALLRPLPYPDPDRLVDVTEIGAADPAREPVLPRLSRLEGDEHGVHAPRRPQRPRPHAGDAAAAP